MTPSFAAPVSTLTGPFGTRRIVDLNVAAGAALARMPWCHRVLQRLRQLGVSGEFVEFFGPGLAGLIPTILRQALSLTRLAQDANAVI